MKTAEIDTTTPGGFRSARQALGLSHRELGRILETNERTVRRWEEDGWTPPHPVAATAMRWFLDGFRPGEWPQPMTGDEFTEARERLGLTVEQFGEVLDVDDDLIRLWSSDERGPPPVVQQATRWLLDGYRPPSWPSMAS